MIGIFLNWTDYNSYKDEYQRVRIAHRYWVVGVDGRIVEIVISERQEIKIWRFISG